MICFNDEAEIVPLKKDSVKNNLNQMFEKIIKTKNMDFIENTNT